MTKLLLKNKARQLRNDGFGYKTIANQLKVSSSTIHRWCKDIILTPLQIEILEKRAHDPYYGKRKENILKQQKKRLRAVEKLKNEGIANIGTLTKRETFLAGASLYWAEGFKKDKRLGFANSDPAMIKFILDWLIKCCHVPKKDIRLRVGLNISHRYRAQKVEKFWSETTKISLEQFQKPFFQQFIWKKEYIKPEEYFGVLRIRANKQLALFRKIHGWIEGLKRNTAG